MKHVNHGLAIRGQRTVRAIIRVTLSVTVYAVYRRSLNCKTYRPPGTDCIYARLHGYGTHFTVICDLPSKRLSCRMGVAVAIEYCSLYTHDRTQTIRITNYKLSNITLCIRYERRDTYYVWFGWLSSPWRVQCAVAGT